MKPKRIEGVNAHKKQRLEAEKYLWHLRPPWLARFDHNHWWLKSESSQEEQSQAGAMWEVLRRHPHTEKLLNRDPALKPPLLEFERYLADFGGCSWLKFTDLNIKFAKYWRKSLIDLPSQWGFVTDGMFEVCPIKDPKIEALGKRYAASVDRYRDLKKIDIAALKEAYLLWNATCDDNGLKVPVLESNASAFNALFGGCILIYFDPAKPGIAEIVNRKVRRLINEIRNNSGKRNLVRRSHWEGWLSVIARFEQGELSLEPKTIRNDQNFARYRRIYKDRTWPGL